VAIQRDVRRTTAEPDRPRIIGPTNSLPEFIKVCPVFVLTVTLQAGNENSWIAIKGR